MNAPLVKILVTVTDPARIAAQTMTLDTVRTGFPNSSIEVTINEPMNGNEEVIEILKKKIDHVEGERRWASNMTDGGRIHHAHWIRRAVMDEVECGGRPIVILDPDVIFWKSCEDWEFSDETMLAGYHVPRCWNDFAKCVSVSRIHTSFMWFKRLSALRALIQETYPYSHSATGHYSPCCPFMPAVRFDNGKPLFWDSCANLYQMLPLRAVKNFDDSHKACFDHLNSASFYDVMAERMPDPSGFKFAHDVLVHTPEKLKGIWNQVDEYYRAKAIEGRIAESQLLTR